jgi:hypothetical protein
LFTEPLVSPYSQIASEGSSTQFICKEPPHARHPDRYEWLSKSSLDESSPLDGELSSQALVSPDGSILELSNISASNAGWYYCCLFYSPVSSLVRSELIFQEENQAEESSSSSSKNAGDELIKYCSSAQLEVRALQASGNEKQRFKVIHIFLIVTCVCLILISLLAVLVYCCFLKLRVIDNAHKAATRLKKVRSF